MEATEVWCKNCDRNITKSNYTTHSLHCENKMERCKACKEPILRSDIESHIQKMHAYIHCEDCHGSMEAYQLEHHKETLCPQRSVICSFCELDKPFQEMEEHELYCGSRTEKCSHCQKFIRIKDLKEHKLSHTETSCVKSSVKCPYCKLDKPLKEIDNHKRSCGSRLVMCSQCQKCIKIGEKEEHDLKHGVDIKLNGCTESENSTAVAAITSQLSNIVIGDQKRSSSSGSQINESSNLFSSSASYDGDNIKNRLAKKDIQQSRRDTYKIDNNEEKTSNDKEKKFDMKLIEDKLKNENYKKSMFKRLEELQKTRKNFGENSTQNQVEMTSHHVTENKCDEINKNNIFDQRNKNKVKESMEFENKQQEKFKPEKQKIEWLQNKNREIEQERLQQKNIQKLEQQEKEYKMLKQESQELEVLINDKCKKLEQEKQTLKKLQDSKNNLLENEKLKLEKEHLENKKYAEYKKEMQYLEQLKKNLHEKLRKQIQELKQCQIIQSENVTKEEEKFHQLENEYLQLQHKNNSEEEMTLLRQIGEKQYQIIIQEKEKLEQLQSTNNAKVERTKTKIKTVLHTIYEKEEQEKLRQKEQELEQTKDNLDEKKGELDNLENKQQEKIKIEMQELENLKNEKHRKKEMLKQNEKQRLEIEKHGNLDKTYKQETTITLKSFNKEQSSKQGQYELHNKQEKEFQGCDLANERDNDNKNEVNQNLFKSKFKLKPCIPSDDDENSAHDINENNIEEQKLENEAALSTQSEHHLVDLKQETLPDKETKFTQQKHILDIEQPTQKDQQRDESKKEKSKVLKEQDTCSNKEMEQNDKQNKQHCFWCKSYFEKNEFYKHLPKCPSRFIKCNKCEKMILVTDYINHGKLCKTKKSNFNNDGADVAENSDQVKKCPNCDLNIELTDFPDHSKSCSTAMKTCTNCSTKMAALELKYHALSCKKPDASLTNETLEDTVICEKKESKIEPTCQVCKNTFSLDEFSEHIESCAEVQITCRYCNKEIKHKDLNFHNVIHHGSEERSLKSIQNSSRLSPGLKDSMSSSHYLQKQHYNSSESSMSLPDKDETTVVLYNQNKFATNLGTCCDSNSIDIMKTKTFDSHESNHRINNSPTNMEPCKTTVDTLKDGKFYDSITYQKSFISEENIMKQNLNGSRQGQISVIEVEKEAETSKEDVSKSTLKCRFCEGRFTQINDLIGHYDKCDFRMTQCLFCHEEIREINKKEHQISCLKNPTVHQDVETAGNSFQESNHLPINGPTFQSGNRNGEFGNQLQQGNMQNQTNDLGKNFIASCPLCPTKFAVEMVINHIMYCRKNYLENIKLSCLLCEEESLAIDIAGHVMECKNNSYSIKCPSCKLQISMSEIHRHFSECHQNTEENTEFTCFICKNKVDINIAEDHINYCNYIIKKSMKLACSICEKKFLLDKIYDHICECSHKVDEKIKVICKTCKVELLINEINDHVGNCHQNINNECAISSISRDQYAISGNQYAISGDQYAIQEINQGINYSCCPWCSNEFSENEIDFHVNTCPNRQEECIYCGRPCLISEKKEHQVHCPMNPYGTGDETNDLKHEQEKDSDKHESVEVGIDIANCESDKEQCYKCMDMFPKYMIVHHQANCALEVCPSCNNEISIWRMQEHQKTCVHEICSSCDNPISVSKIDQHFATCMKEVCPSCNNLFPLSAIRQHARICLEEKKAKGSPDFEEVAVKMGFLPCADCHQIVLDLDTHDWTCVKHECTNCGRKFPLTELESHKELCNKEALEYHKLKVLEDECPFCKGIFPASELDKHKRYCAAKMEKIWERENAKVGRTGKKCYKSDSKMNCRNTCHSCENTSHLSPCKQSYKEHNACAGNSSFKNQQSSSEEQERLKKESQMAVISFMPKESSCMYCSRVFPYQIYGEHVYRCGKVKQPCFICSKPFQRCNLIAHIYECHKKNSGKMEEIVKKSRWQNLKSSCYDKFKKLQNWPSLDGTAVQTFDFDQSKGEQWTAPECMLLPCQNCNKIFEVAPEQEIEFIMHMSECVPELKNAVEQYSDQPAPGSDDDDDDSKYELASENRSIFDQSVDNNSHEMDRQLSNPSAETTGSKSLYCFNASKCDQNSDNSAYTYSNAVTRNQWTVHNTPTERSYTVTQTTHQLQRTISSNRNSSDSPSGLVVLKSEKHNVQNGKLKAQKNSENKDGKSKSKKRKAIFQ